MQTRMKNTLVLLSLLAVTVTAHAQASTAILWERTFGGNEVDVARAARPTSDGGFIVGGYSYSEISGTKTASSHGAGDFWLVKLDANGARQWDKSFGGVNFDGLHALQTTSDGGYILGGVSFSGATGNKTTAQQGSGDFWIVKVNASGTKQWEKTYGGSSNEVLRALQPTSDGGYILGGVTLSGASGNKTSTAHGAMDYWVVKVDASGNKQWERAFGGSADDELQSVAQTADGGFIVGGHSLSAISGNKGVANFAASRSDWWVLKLDASGNKQWEKCFGGVDAEEFRHAVPVAGGYILAGQSYSEASGNKSTSAFGSHDYWVVKVDTQGNKLWEKSFGGDDADELHHAELTSDGGFLLSGFSSSGASGNKSSSMTSATAREFWIVKLDAAGAKQWEQSMAGGFSGELVRLQTAGAGGYVVASLGQAGTEDFALTGLSGPLRINSFVVRADGTFLARANGTAGGNYSLEASVDFITWTPLMTKPADGNGVVSFSGNISVGEVRKFYRVQAR